MTEKRKKIKRRRNSLIKRYSFELLILFLILTGVFLLVENMEIKSTIIYYVTGLMKFGLQFFQSIITSLSGFIQSREGSDIIGMGLIFLAIILLYFRYRKMILTEWNSGKNCPGCESKMVRKKKESKHKILAKIFFLKVRHYSCAKCNESKLNFR